MAIKPRIRGAIERLDEIAGLEKSTGLILWLERAAFVFTALMVISAPHSIAVSQGGWAIGTVCWLGSFSARVWSREKPHLTLTFLAVPVLLFFFWTVFTAFVSYAPDISLGKLPSVSLFTVFFLTVNMFRTRKALKFAVFALFISCMVNVIWMPIERIPGRGVEVRGLDPNGALAKAGAKESDTLLEVNGKRISGPEDLVDEIRRSGKGEIRFYRPDFYEFYTVGREDLARETGAGPALGFESWGRSRNWRSSGFYGMYATYAEVLVLIGSLVAGLLAAGIRRRKTKQGEPGTSSGRGSMEMRAPHIPVLGISLVLIAAALLLTVTRASQASFVLAVLIIFAISIGRKALVVLLIALVPVTLAGIFFLQQARNVSFIDPKDNSTTWRLTVYREGIGLWLDSPRNMLVGVGMDSQKRFKEEWGLFDGGRLPVGHFHSTPLQLLVDRGAPALLLWVWIVWTFLRRSWIAVRRGNYGAWWEHGLLLGGFGGMIGFLTSGMVHYNLGDSEVAMILFLMMGLSVLTIERYAEQKPAGLPGAA